MLTMPHVCNGSLIKANYTQAKEDIKLIKKKYWQLVNPGEVMGCGGICSTNFYEASTSLNQQEDVSSRRENCRPILHKKMQKSYILGN